MAGYRKRLAQSDREYLDENYQWPIVDDENDADPNLLDDSEYQLSDGIFSKQEAYTILKKATGLDVNYDEGVKVNDTYRFIVDGIGYFVFPDGEINTSQGDVFNRNVNSFPANLTPEEDAEVANSNQNVIQPFDPDIALNYINRFEDFPPQYGLEHYEVNDDGSYTLSVKDNNKARNHEPNSHIGTFVVYPDGTYYQID